MAAPKAGVAFCRGGRADRSELAYRQHKSTRKAARSLGITHSMLVRRLAKYHIQKEPNAEEDSPETAKGRASQLSLLLSKNQITRT